MYTIKKKKTLKRHQGTYTNDDESIEATILCSVFSKY